jgi:hypothetical protein
MAVEPSSCAESMNPRRAAIGEPYGTPFHAAGERTVDAGDE